MSKPFFLSFDEGAENIPGVELVGGKAASLIHLFKEGFLIPNGVVITTEFFEHCAEREISLCLAEVAESIIDHANKSCFVEKVAVRSSVTVEDSGTHSFAGQFDSFLDVEKTQIVDTIGKCWQSLHSSRSEHYAQSQNNSADKKMAVIVQEMVIAEVSGVAFSIDPVSGENTTVIEAVFGSNESLVQGDVTPDYYKMSKGLKLLEKSIVAQDGSSEQKLSDSQLKMIAQHVLKIKEYFGFEVDVEWAIENGQFYVLQSRPITAVQK